jgi:long-chain fatty acid transport protein
MAAILLGGMLPGLCAAQLQGLPMTGFAAGGTGLTPFYVLGFELGPWQDYLARELTPPFMAESDLPPLHISWLDAEAVSILPAFADGLVGRPRTWTRFQVDWQYLDANGMGGIDQAMLAPGKGFERQLLTSGLYHELSGNSLLGVEAVMAYQSYGTSRLGMRSLSGPLPGASHRTNYQPYQETGYGTGVRLNVHSEVLPGMAFDAGFQSRIDMEEFGYYRGVYSAPADFDIPARASVGLAFQTTDRAWLNLSIERVMYSDVSAFPSRMLPDRFLSMLGDSTSPAFTWDDLTVYSVGWTWSNGKDVQWNIDFSSRSTPSPTSRSLSRALEDELADSAMLVGYSKRMSERSRFNINAAYASADFIFGGNVLGVASDNLDQNLEVEAFWVWDF